MATVIENSTVGFAPDEIRTDAPTREARLKWVVVVDDTLAPGPAANAAVCVAAATSRHVGGLLGPEAVDTDGGRHPGLPWAGCTVLGASGDRLVELRARAAGALGVFVADMPAAAAETRVYDEYLARVSGLPAAGQRYLAVSVVGPRGRVDKLVGGLRLLGR